MPKENIIDYKSEIPKKAEHKNIINMLGKKFGFGAKKIKSN